MNYSDQGKWNINGILKNAKKNGLKNKKLPNHKPMGKALALSKALLSKSK